MPTVKKCAIVVRVSDPRQATHEQNTIDLQIAEVRKFIETKNFNDRGIEYQEFKVYKLLGVSGSKSFDSLQFDELDMDIALERVQVVICTALDRLGRDVKGFISFWDDLRHNNVELIITRMSLDTSTPIGSMLLVVLMALSKLELDIKTERNRLSTRARGKEGLYNGHRPILGYDLNPDPNIAGRLVVNQQEAPIVELAFKEYLKLGSDKKVAVLLTSLGYKNKRWQNRQTKKWNGGGVITHSVIRTMLTNVTYTSHRKYNDIDPDTGESVEMTTPGVWPAIIDDDLFKQVKEARRKAYLSKGNIAKRDGVNHFNLLIQVVYCKYCDEKMKTTSGTSRTGKQVYHYYSCSNDDCSYYLEGNSPVRNSVNSDELDEVAYDVLAQVVSSDEKVSEFTSELNKRITEEQPKLQGKLKRLTGRRTLVISERLELMKSLGKLDKDSFAFSETEKEINKITKMLQGLEKERKILGANLSQIRSNKISKDKVKAYLQNMRELMKNGTENQRRSVVRLLFSSIILNPKEAKFNFHSESYFFYQFVNRKHGVRADSDMAPRSCLPANYFLVQRNHRQQAHTKVKEDLQEPHHSGKRDGS
ncbi:MAG: recombinase family protein [Candidatus Sabulitectum sp.]|nr:recombinase family protein [Candidatus Sabulitectum sp.]